jgi:hypothetical protein
VDAAMAVFYLVQFVRRMPAVAGTAIAMIGLLAFYKVGNPQYFHCPAVLLIYFLASPTGRSGVLDGGLLAAAAGYLAVLSIFEAWYLAFNTYAVHAHVSAFIGLPCFLTSAALLWRLMLHERATCPAAP